MPINRIESGVPPSKYNHILLEETQTGNISAGSGENTVFTPPAGKLWQVLNMYLMAQPPSGASSGIHSYTLIVGNINILSGGSVFGSLVNWNSSCWEAADSFQYPDTAVAAQNALTSTHIIKENPLTVRYFNNANEIQTQSRYIYLSILETPLI